MEVYHKTPKENGGTDKYRNLVFVTSDIHKLVHATQKETIEKYLSGMKNIYIDFKRLNQLRNLVGNYEICNNR